jgi:signal transduction histidine kinase
VIASDPDTDDRAVCGASDAVIVRQAFRDGEVVTREGHAGADSILAVPLEEGPQGHTDVLAICWRRTRRFTFDDGQFVRHLTDAAAVALSHAAAYRRERDTAEELRKLQKLRAHFLGMVAHDLRTPLTVIRGVANFMQSAQASADQREHLLKMVDEQVDYTNRLVNDLLEVARIEAGRLNISPEPLHLTTTIQDAVEEIPRADEAIVDVDEDVWVLADRHRLKQIVVNLLSNAVRHGAPPITVRARRLDHRAVIEFSDCGPGVPAERIESLFQPFSSGLGRGSVGLGLAIVRGLVEAHGGTLSYRPNEPTGACFTATLPAPEAPTGTGI